MKKIEGWVDPKMWDDGPEGFRLTRLYEAKSQRDVRAVLLIGEGDTPPKVFTETEVRTMLLEMEDGITGALTQEQWNIARKHGIELNF